MTVRELRLNSIYLHVCRFVLFFVVASVSFNGFYQKWHFHDEDLPGDNADATLQGMVEGTAHRPYVYRQLIPAIVNGVDRVVPQTTKTWLYSLQGSGEDAYIYAITISPVANGQEFFFRYLTAYTVTFLFAFLAVYAMYWVCLALGSPPPAALFASVVFMLLFPYIMSVGGYFYDFSELALFALAILMAVKLDWWWLIPLVALGEWNKESFLLIVLTLYPFFRLRRSRANALLGVCVLCLICLTIYYPIRLHFAHNPGGTVEVQWREQLQYFAHPLATLFTTEETYGVRMIRVFTLIPMILLGWTMLRGWKYLPAVARRHGYIASAINIPLFLLFCSPGELRDLSMLYIVFLLVLASNLTRWIGGMVATPSVAIERR